RPRRGVSGCAGWAPSARHPQSEIGTSSPSGGNYRRWTCKVQALRLGERGVKLRIQGAPGLLPGDRLERTALRMAPEHQVRPARKRARLDDAAILQPNAR